MKKFLVVGVIVFCTTLVFAATIAHMTGIQALSADEATSLMLGYNDYELLDASAGDDTAGDIVNGRAIGVDQTGIAKFTYINNAGATITEVKVLNAGAIYPIRNVNKEFRYYIGSTSCTVASYSSAGALVSGAIKVYR